MAVQPAAGAPSQPCAAIGYVALLHDAQQALDSDPPQLSRARDVVGRVVAIADPSVLGRALADLERQPPEIADARIRIDAVAATLDLPAGSGCRLDQTAATDALNDVYRSRAFSGFDQASDRTAAERAADFLGSLISSTPRSIGSAAVAAILIALVALAVIRARSRWRPAVVTSRWAVTPAAGSPPDPDREWRAATSAAAKGRHREAIGRAYRSCLMTVSVTGLLPIDPSWTTGQLLARSGADPELARALRPAATSFDRAWYSSAPVTTADWEAARGSCQEVRQLARRRRRVPR